MESSGQQSPEQCSKFLTIHSSILHPRHAHMLDMRHTLMLMLGHCEGHLMSDLDDRQLQAKEDAARNIISIADKILPGISRLKGTTLYELFLVYQQRALNWKNLRAKMDVLAALSVRIRSH
jgi:hypothetical protein